MKRRRDKRRITDDRKHARDDLRRDESYISTLRRFQLAAAAVMFVGLTTSTLVCAGEFNRPWLVATGGALFLLGILCYFVATPAARFWSRRK
jgi:hypothetical protein